VVPEVRQFERNSGAACSSMSTSFPFLESLRLAWADIRAECLALAADSFEPWVQREMYGERGHRRTAGQEDPSDLATTSSAAQDIDLPRHPSRQSALAPFVACGLLVRWSSPKRNRRPRSSIEIGRTNAAVGDRV
jgi:hypothetical protein